MNPIHADDYIRILPELVLTAFGVAVMLLDPLLPAGKSRRGLGILSLIGTLVAIVAACLLPALATAQPQKQFVVYIGN